jgi:hypothetical protein
MDLGQSTSARAQLDNTTGELQQGSIEHSDQAVLRDGTVCRSGRLQPTAKAAA